jgi:ketosteroid isomerase-like protein
MRRSYIQSPVRRLLLAPAAALLLLFAPVSFGQTPSQPDERDSQAIQNLIVRYASALNAEPVDMDALSQVWLDSPDDSFIYPLGHEHGWEQIKRNLYQNIMEAYFSERKLAIRDIHLHIYGDSAWAEFYWHFTAKPRKGSSVVETDGRETQIYRNLGQGRWALVHVHYSAMPPSKPPAAQ